MGKLIKVTAEVWLDSDMLERNVGDSFELSDDREWDAEYLIRTRIEGGMGAVFARYTTRLASRIPANAEGIP